MSRTPHAVIVVVILWLGALARAEPTTVGQTVVYGEDDRVEVGDHPSELIRTLAESSVVTLVAKAMLEGSDQSDIAFRAPTLGDSQELCADERFVDQPTAGFCSGTLIGPDLVLTAGHCFAAGQLSCEQTMVVFGLQWGAGGLARIDADQVFSCRNLVVHEDRSIGRMRDYAIFQLDRPASDFVPAAVVSSRPVLSPGERFVLIGSPSGLPVKVDDGGWVRDPRSAQGDYLEGTPDTFGGNSGSGVFLAESLELFGILIEGEADYVSDGGCNRVNLCSESGCGGEKILYATAALDDLCDVATDEVLCGSSSVCGDGFCAWNETPIDCSDDCRSDVCGDKICGRSEWSDCPADCQVVKPREWICEDSWYGTLDGCDCECGAPDPDCALGQETVSCELLQTCDASGRCVDDPSSLCECSRLPERSVAGAFGFALAFFGLLATRRRWRLAGPA